MDFSIYDAKQAGFEKVIFIIKKANEKDFKESIGDRMAKIMDVDYAFQELTDLPEGFSVPEGPCETIRNCSCNLKLQRQDRRTLRRDQRRRLLRTSCLQGDL